MNDGESLPPPELLLAWKCEKWEVLPDSGAMLDQDYRLISLMTGLSNIYRVVVKLNNMHGEEIHRLRESERRILRGLVDLGVLFNG